MRYFLGIDLSDDNLKYGISDASGHLMVEADMELAPVSSAQVIVSSIKTAIDELMDYAKDKGYEIAGVGIATPGLVDTVTGVVIKGPDLLPEWDQIELGELIRDYVDRPVYIDNKARCLGLAEHLYGVCKGVSDFVYIYLGNNLEGALYINNNSFSGYKNRGAGFGQIPVSVLDHEKSVCTLNEVASVVALLANYKAKLTVSKKPIPDNLSFDLFVLHYEQGVEEAKEAFSSFSNYLSGTIAGFINIFSPQKVVLGGEFEYIDDFLLTELRDCIKQYVVQESSENTKLERASMRKQAGCIGAAALVYTA